MQSRCAECDCVRARGKNDEINAVSKLAYRMAGSSRLFYVQSKDKRTAMRAQATELHELGADIVLATSALATEKRGFVYVITNPAWPCHVKIGRAFDPEARLRGYQTSCPNRDYELYAAVYFEDCHFAEQEIHARLDLQRADGEWFAISPFLARHTINKLRSLL